MDYGALITGLLGGGAVFSFIQFWVTRHDAKKSDIDLLKREVSAIRKSQEDMAVRVSRMELINLIRDDSENVDAILQVAEHYFIELDGNAYAHAMFEKWAKAHDVPVGWLPKLKERERKRTK